MNNEDMKKRVKEEIGFVPPGIMIGQNFGEELQSIIGDYHHQIWKKEGAIPLKYRYLIALATAVFDENEKRARLELTKAINHGANREEILEVLKQQVWMKGAPTLVQIAPLIKFMEEKLNR